MVSFTQTAGELLSEGGHVAKDLVRKTKDSIVPSETDAQTEEASSGFVYESTEDADASEPLIVGSRAKRTPFYDLIAYVFQNAQNKPAILPLCIPTGLSNNHKGLYKAAIDELRKPGPVQAKDVLQTHT
ncbi:hypothetical protein BGZ73_005915 [Actinomortierella ambigua]|nr:hypothetical protein BGZ73_005915 [Actinomortierella ambigua]